ncbi:MAG: hypothetical protein LQ350_003328 [Teloschistes chrysophthalmus]|nr:MAG: hypothetical protein LQ350_003328 [Niorma chrysophthalma]
MPVTRRGTKEREAQGILPSPLREIPAELSGRRKKTKPSTRSTITPDSDGDAAVSQNQDTTTHALREGNAGGYVGSASSTQGIREHQDSLPVVEQHDMAPQNNDTLSPGQQSAFEAAAAAVGIVRGSPPVSSFILSESIQTPPHSPVFSFRSPITLTGGDVPTLLVQTGVSPVQSGEELATPAQSVSPTTDGQEAAVVSPPIIFNTSPVITSDASTQSEALPINASAQSEAPLTASSQVEVPLITTRDWSTSTRIPTSQDISVQTTVSAISFRPLGLYGFRSELAVPPRSCSMTICLGNDKEIRVSKISAEAMHEIAGILHDHNSIFERNWLTPSEEAAAAAVAAAAAAAVAAAAKCAPSSTTKRKREDQVESPPSAQRRRIEIETEADPTSTSATSPPKQSSRKGIRRLRQMALDKALTDKARTDNLRSQRTLANALISLREADAKAKSVDRYNEKGELRLLGQPVDQPENDHDDEDIPIYGTFAPFTEGSEPVFGPFTQASEQVFAPANLSSDQVENQPSQAQTPDHSSWRLGSLFNTAKRFIPGIRRQDNSSPSSQTIQPSVHTSVAVDTSNNPSQQVTQTEPRHQDQHSGQVNAEAQSNFAERVRDSQKSSKKAFRNKENIAELKKLRAEKERIKVEWAQLQEECRITELARQDVEAAHRAAYAAQTTGTKRRAISPEVIPNPPGVSYGMDLAYFGFSSSEEDEEPNPSRKTCKMPPFKVRRTHGPDSPQSAKGKYASVDDEASKSADTEALLYKGSSFSDSAPNVFRQSKARSDEGKPRARRQEFLKELVFDDGRVLRLSDHNFNHSGHFEVPWSPDSSDEDEPSSSETPAGEQSLSPVVVEKANSGHDMSAPAGANNQATKIPISQQPSLASILQSSNASNLGQTKPMPAMQPPVTFAPTQGVSTTTSLGLTTPTPKNAVPGAGAGKNIEASKTLERNRAMLRAQVAEKSGRFVLSPKDIAKNNSTAAMSQQCKPVSTFQVQSQKAKTGSQTPDSLFIPPGSNEESQATSLFGATTGTEGSSDPSTKSVEQDHFSILGAAGRASPESPSSPKSPGQKLAETLPSVQSQVSRLQAYNEYQQTMDPKVKEVLEASWAASDEAASSSAFQTPFTAFLSSQQPEAKQSSLHRQQLGAPVAEDELDDYDDAQFYENDQNQQGAGTGGAAVVSEGASDVLGSTFQMDPVVSAYLETHWTAEDETYASDEFKGNFPNHKTAGAPGAASTNQLNFHA